MFETARITTTAAGPPRPRLTLVAETPGDYQAGPGDTPGRGGSAGPGDAPPGAAAAAGPEDALAGLATAVAAVVAADPVGLSTSACSERARTVTRQVRRLQAHVADLMAAVTDRDVADATRDTPHDRRARERAERRSRARHRRNLGISDRQVRDAVEGARQPGSDDGPAQQARRDGRLGPEHARIAADILGRLRGGARDRVEAELVAHAHLDPRGFGRLARRLLAEADHDAAMRRLDHQHARRRASVTTTGEGTTRLSAEVAGIDGEVVAAAIDAFRTRDGAATPRTPQQRTADALVAALRAALEHGTTATGHGVRPHVQVTVDWDRLRTGTGVGHTPWTGPLPVGELRRLLGDSTLARLVCAGASRPIDTGRATRTVSTAIWRALVARDRGCTWPGCDAPPAWCDAAHTDRRWHQGAGVSVDQLALACRHHHRHIDRNQLTGRLHHDRIIWERPAGPHPTRPDADGSPTPVRPASPGHADLGHHAGSEHRHRGDHGDHGEHAGSGRPADRHNRAGCRAPGDSTAPPGPAAPPDRGPPPSNSPVGAVPLFPDPIQRR